MKKFTRRHIAILIGSIVAGGGICAGVVAAQSQGNPAPTTVQAQQSVTAQFGIAGLDDELFAQNGVSLNTPTVQPDVSKEHAEVVAEGFVPEGKAVTAVFADAKNSSVHAGMEGVVHCWVVIVKTSVPQVPAGPHRTGTPFPATGNNMEIVLVDGHTGKVLLGWRSAAMPVLK